MHDTLHLQYNKFLPGQSKCMGNDLAIVINWPGVHFFCITTLVLYFITIFKVPEGTLLKLFSKYKKVDNEIRFKIVKEISQVGFPKMKLFLI